MKIALGLVPLLSGVALAREPAAAVHPALWPQIPHAIAPNAALEARIGKLLGEMTLEQKVGQLIQADIGSITPDDLLHYPLGSILNGGSSAPGNNEFASPSEWLMLADRFYEASMDASHPQFLDSAHVIATAKHFVGDGGTGGRDRNGHAQVSGCTNVTCAAAINAGMDVIMAAITAGGGTAELSVAGNFKSRPSVAIVVFGENPYAEFQGDIGSVEYSPGDTSDLELIRRLLGQGVPVVAVFLSDGHCLDRLHTMKS